MKEYPILTLVSCRCIQHFRYKLTVHLEDLLNHEDFRFKDELEIINSVIEHTEYYHHYQQRLLDLVAFEFDSSAARSYDIEIVTSSLTEEWYAFEEIVARAEEILQETQSESDFPPSTFWPGNQQPEIVLNEKLLVPEALELLWEPDNRGLTPQKTLLDVIHDFFVSPDIAPNFLNVSRISFQRFFDLVDNLVDENFSFTPKELQAFLLFCNECAELFSFKGDIITALDSGWELLDETLPSPLPRQKTFVAPEGSDDFEAFLLSNEDAIFLKANVKDSFVSRRIQEDELVNKIMAIYPGHLSAEVIQNFLAYYSHTGKYFR